MHNSQNQRAQAGSEEFFRLIGLYVVVHHYADFVCVDVVVRTSSGGFGASHPKFTFSLGTQHWMLVMQCIADKNCVATYNMHVEQTRNDRVAAKVRAVGLTVLNQEKLVLEFRLCPDDSSAHFHAIFRDIVLRQLEADSRCLPKAVYVDNMQKYAKG